MTPEQRSTAIEKLNKFSLRKLSPCKQWRGMGYFDVPGAVMRELEDEGIVESRKKSGHAPTEYRRK